ncbi:hypothetical protein ACN38_g2826 [Penicillium nordicum]|uniref:Uncharacterized protein n=1 Tax=Penicillium nordicum TaxID=229535 RepID=A0A0M9WII5_9EURO|nr:hypothetical protein ACN38_g2826 [Penicillium nordicum]
MDSTTTLNYVSVSISVFVCAQLSPIEAGQVRVNADGPIKSPCLNRTQLIGPLCLKLIGLVIHPISQYTVFRCKACQPGAETPIRNLCERTEGEEWEKIAGKE